MKEYDVVVIGSGTGLSLVHKALSEKAKVALVASEYLGGTCLNVGCIPSKLLIASADRAMEIAGARPLGISVSMNIDFKSIMRRMRDYVRQGASFLREDIGSTEHLDFYETECRFISDYTLEMENDGSRIRGHKIFIATGARPFIPPIEGLDATGFLTNETLLSLEQLPESLLVLGGSYVGVEYAHFFSAMGSRVTLIEKMERLVPSEEPDVSDLLKRELEKRMIVHTSATAVEARGEEGGVHVRLRNKESGGESEASAAALLVATGRVSNADRLHPEKTGVRTDARGFITVDPYLRTTKERIWAVGDATGRQMFTHAGDKEVDVAWHNATHDEKKAMDFDAVPHAVFTMPQIASIGLTEAAARKEHKVLVGKANYTDVVQGDARMEEAGFAKAIIEKENGRILGFHIIGSDASILIQEVVNAVASGAPARSITDSMHIFPAMSELIVEAINKAE